MAGAGGNGDGAPASFPLGLEAYRFSISWSRLIPNGRGAVNPKGLEYYNNLIDELVNHGIQVHITLHHVDLPQILEDEFGGWLSPRIVEDFTAYADVCFREFGDRVASWTTMDEANIGPLGSYGNSLFPPGRCSDPFGATKCTAGDSSIEPYIAANNTLMAHASVFSLYREKYQHKQKGIVGINIYSYWSYPLTNATVDIEATQRCKDFLYGWILEPLVFGDYPQVMKKNVGSRLPPFTKVQSELIRGSLDFIGINHYFSVYVNDHPLDKGVRDYTADMSVDLRGSRTDPPAGQVKVYVINVFCKEVANSGSLGHALPIWFAWAFMDLFELLAGYQARYGLYRVDFADERLPRQARLSARWYSGFLKHNGTSALASRAQVNQALNLVS